MSNWIDDGHGNKWHRCKLGADCGLKVIEAGKARCWCQDQEASRCEMQVAREQIRCLEADNERLRDDKARLDSGTILLTLGGERVHHIGVNLRAAIDAGRKEAQP